MFPSFRLSLLLAWTSMLASSLGGVIQPQNESPIQLSFANMNQQYVEYTFDFTTQTALNSEGILVIYFPTAQYSDIGSPSCLLKNAGNQEYDITLSNCSKRNNVNTALQMDFTDKAAGSYSIKLRYINNPREERGTGFFHIETLKGNFVVDKNPLFATVGFSPEASTFTAAAIETTGTNISQPNYFVTLIVKTALPANSRIQVFFPSEWTVPVSASLSCVTQSGNYNGKDFDRLTVTNSFCNNIGNNTLEFGGEYGAVAADTTIRLEINGITSPLYEIQSTARIYTLRQNTNTILDMVEEASLRIRKSTLSPSGGDPAVTAHFSNIPLVKATENYLKLTIYSTKTWPADSRISILWDDIPIKNTCFVGAGLSPQGYNEEIVCRIATTDQNLMIVENFAEVAADTKVEIITRVTLDATAGATDPLEIKVEAPEIIDGQLQYTGSFPKMIGTIEENVVASGTSYTVLDRGTKFNAPLVVNVQSGDNYINAPGRDIEFVVQPTGSDGADILDEVRIHVSQQAFVLTANDLGCAVQEFGAGGRTSFTDDNPVGQKCQVTGDNLQYTVTTGGAGFTNDQNNSVVLETMDIAATASNNQSVVYLIAVEYYDQSTATVINYDTVLLVIEPADIPTLAVNSRISNTDYPAEFDFAITAPAAVTQFGNKKPRIELWFPVEVNAAAAFRADLGTNVANGGAFQCYFNDDVNNINNESKQCVLYQGNTATNRGFTRLVIYGYNSIEANKVIEISLAAKTSRATGEAEYVDVYLGTTDDGTVEYLYKKRVQIHAAMTTPGAPPTLATATVAFQDSTVNATGVGVTTTIEAAADSQTGGAIYLWVPSGWDWGVNNKPQCTISIAGSPAAAVATSRYYANTSWSDNRQALMVVPIETNIVASQTAEVVCPGVTMPQNVKDGAGTAFIYATLDTFAFLGRREDIAIPDFTAAAVNTFSLSQTSSLAGDLNVRSSFEIAFAVAAPEDSYITITFPSTYTLTDGFITCDVQNLTPMDGFNAVKCEKVTGVRRIQVTKFKAITALNVFQIRVYGVQNPQTVGVTTAFTIENSATAAGGTVIQSDSTNLTTNIVGTFTDGESTIASHSLTPTSAGAFADLSVTMSFSIGVKERSQISIVLPGDYHNQGSSDTEISCAWSGALSGTDVLDGCTVEFTNPDITFTTSIAIPANQELTVLVTGIKNFNIEKTTVDGIEVNVKFSGVTYIETPIGAEAKKVTTTVAPEDVEINSIANEPRTEGALAIYTFQFRPLADIPEADNLFIIVPKELGTDYASTNLFCSSTELGASLTCSTSGRKIMVNSRSNYTVDLNNKTFITLKVYGIKNPNYNLQHYYKFQIGSSSGSAYTSLSNIDNSRASITMKKDAGSIESITLNVGNPFARKQGSYNFIFKVSKSVPRNGGIFIDFPSDYNFDVSKTYACSTQSAFAIDRCFNTNNKFTIIASQDYTTTTTAIDVTISSVDHPTIITTNTPTNIFLLSTFDASNEIVDQTYANLFNPDDLRVNFTYNGILLHVNGNNALALTKGTYSQWYDILPDDNEGFKQAVTLTPSLSSNAIKIEPNIISIQEGDVKGRFRVYADRDVQTGSYKIEWSKKEGVSEQVTTERYTEALDSVLVVGNGPSEVTVNPISLNVPLGGSSSVVRLEIANPPFELLEFQLSLIEDGVTANQLTISESTVKALPMQNLVTFRLGCDAAAQAGQTYQIKITLAGHDSPSYTFSGNTFRDLTFTVTNPTVTAPNITDVVVSNVERTYADVDLTTSSQIGIVYYQISLDGATEYSFADIKSRAETTNTYREYDRLTDIGAIYFDDGDRMAKTQFGLFTPDNVSDRFRISYLEAGREYKAYLYVENNSGVVATQAYVQAVTTKPVEASYLVNLQFEDSPTDFEQLASMKAMSKVLSVSSEHIFNYATMTTVSSSNSTGSRLLSDSEEVTDQTGQRRILANPSLFTILVRGDETNDNPSNGSKLTSLTKDQLKEFLVAESVRTDLASFESSALETLAPKLKVAPTVKKATIDTKKKVEVVLEVQTEAIGLVYASVGPTADNQDPPSNILIRDGLDSKFKLYASGWVYCAEADKTYELTLKVESMEAKTSYNIFVTTSNAIPVVGSLGLVSEVEKVTLDDGTGTDNDETAGAISLTTSFFIGFFSFFFTF